MKAYFTLRTFSTLLLSSAAGERDEGIGKRKYSFIRYFSYPFPTPHQFRFSDETDIAAPYCTAGYGCGIAFVSSLVIIVKTNKKVVLSDPQNITY